MTAPLATLGVVAVVGRTVETRPLVGSWLASLAAFHAPGELRIAGLVPRAALEDWDWLKWLPHCRDPQAGRGSAGPVARCRPTAPRSRPKYPTWSGLGSSGSAP